MKSQNLITLHKDNLKEPKYFSLCNSKPMPNQLLLGDSLFPTFLDSIDCILWFKIARSFKTNELLAALTSTITVNMNGSAIHLSQGLNFKMVSMNMGSPLSSDILIKVLCNILGKIVSIPLLKLTRFCSYISVVDIKSNKDGASDTN